MASWHDAAELGEMLADSGDEQKIREHLKSLSRQLKKEMVKAEGYAALTDEAEAMLDHLGTRLARGS